MTPHHISARNNLGENLLDMGQDYTMAPPHISEINNMGANLLEMGDCLRAQEYFRLALKWMKKNAKSSMYQAQQVLVPKPRRRIQLVPSVLSRPQQNEASHFFIKAISINCTDKNSSFSPVSIEEYKICSAVVAFNLGLVLHLTGIRRYSASCLARSKLLYKQSYKLLIAAVGYLNASSGDALIDLLYMAVLNNMATLSLETLDDNVSALLFRRLRYFADSALRQTHEDSKLRIYMTKIIQLFMTNLELCSHSLYHPASAA